VHVSDEAGIATSRTQRKGAPPAPPEGGPITMSSSDPRADREVFVTNALEASVRIGLVGLLAYVSIQITKPFLAPLVWGVVIAISTRPLYGRLRQAVGGRSSLAAAIFALIGLVLVIGPTVALTGTLVVEVEQVSGAVHAGEVRVPPPPDDVADWPLVGSRIHRTWSLAATNLESAVERFSSQVRAIALWLLELATGVGGAVLLFALSIAIAAVMHTQAEGGERVAQALARRIAGERGPELTSLASSTIRGVVKGVLGVALIQSLAAGLGMLALDVPVAGLWTLAVLLMAIMQLPTVLLMLPISIYVFSYADALPATLFLIWSVSVSLSDNILKPLLLARGVEVPMPVVLIGALGGFASIGLLGLFIGPIVLAVGYTVLGAWVDIDEQSLGQEAVE